MVPMLERLRSLACWVVLADRSVTVSRSVSHQHRCPKPLPRSTRLLALRLAPRLLAIGWWLIRRMSMLSTTFSPTWVRGWGALHAQGASLLTESSLARLTRRRSSSRPATSSTLAWHLVPCCPWLRLWRRATQPFRPFHLPQESVCLAHWACT